MTTRIGTVLWMSCLQFFIAEQFVRSGWTLPYSFARNYVSDLAATTCSALICSPRHALMNVSFVVQGLAIAGGAILTWRSWSGGLRTAMGLLLICGMGVTIVGFVPEDADAGLHRFGAALHLLGGGLGMMAAGVSLRRWFGWGSAIAGVTVVAATLMLGVGGEMWADTMGSVERVAVYGIAGWMVAIGVHSYLRLIVGKAGPIAGSIVEGHVDSFSR